MPYTSHGHWYGPGQPTEPPHVVARCGGPAICTHCAREAARTPLVFPGPGMVSLDNGIPVVFADPQPPLADRVTELEAEVIRLRNREHALEGDGAELLDRVEHAEAIEKRVRAYLAELQEGGTVGLIRQHVIAALTDVLDPAAGARRRQLLDDLTAEAIDAGTYDQPAPGARPMCKCPSGCGCHHQEGA